MMGRPLPPRLRQHVFLQVLMREIESATICRRLRMKYEVIVVAEVIRTGGSFSCCTLMTPA